MKKGIVMYRHEPQTVEEQVNSIIGAPDEQVKWRIVLLPDKQTDRQTKTNRQTR